MIGPKHEPQLIERKEKGLVPAKPLQASLYFLSQFLGTSNVLFPGIGKNEA
jgi:hypothetical protein